jgi:hypothetical protein
MGWCTTFASVVAIGVALLAVVLGVYWHHVDAFLRHRDLERQYKAVIVARSQKAQRDFDAKHDVVPCVTCRLDVPVYATMDRVKGMTHDRFLHDYLFAGKPVIVTDVDTHWPLKDMNLSDLARMMPDAPLLPRAFYKGKGLGIRGLRVWESLAASTLAHVAQLHRDQVPDSFYYSHLNVHYNTSLLAQGLYTVPYFLNQSEDFIAEWMYIGSSGSGVMPHIDHMCMGKWSYQIRGNKTWWLHPSVPEMTHLAPLQTTVHEGELLVFLPDHVHGTECEPDASGASVDCVSLHGYLELPYDGNCYLQTLMNMGYDAYFQRRVMPSDGAGFVSYASGDAKTRFEGAPSDYFFRCPPRHQHHTVQCKLRAAKTVDPVLSN